MFVLVTSALEMKFASLGERYVQETAEVSRGYHEVYDFYQAQSLQLLIANLGSPTFPEHV